jgi:hypothetical protein
VIRGHVGKVLSGVVNKKATSQTFPDARLAPTGLNQDNILI